MKAGDDQPPPTPLSSGRRCGTDAAKAGRGISRAPECSAASGTVVVRSRGRVEQQQAHGADEGRRNHNDAGAVRSPPAGSMNAARVWPSYRNWSPISSDVKALLATVEPEKRQLATDNSNWPVSPSTQLQTKPAHHFDDFATCRSLAWRLLTGAPSLPGTSESKESDDSPEPRAGDQLPEQTRYRCAPGLRTSPDTNVAGLRRRCASCAGPRSHRSRLRPPGGDAGASCPPSASADPGLRYRRRWRVKTRRRRSEGRAARS